MILESLSGASWAGLPGDTGCTAVVALLWVGEVEYICGPGPHQAAHQGEAPVGRALENGIEDVNERERVRTLICTYVGQSLIRRLTEVRLLWGWTR